MSRLGFIILSILKGNEAVTKLSSMTIREIMLVENFEVKENTVFKRIREFEGCGYIDRGLKEGHAATFYITAAGQDFLEELRYEEKERRIRHEK